MNGQWLGRYEGNQAGAIYFNVDELLDTFAGSAYLHPHDSKFPSSHVVFTMANKSLEQTFKTAGLLPINPVTAVTDQWDNIKHLYPSMNFSKEAEVTAKLRADKLELSWKTDIGIEGKAVLERSHAKWPSLLVPEREVDDWPRFKSFVTDLEPRRYMFRGQTRNWRLQTTYHRRGRADLRRYRLEDVPTLHRHLSGRTRHFYNINDADQTGAFYSLIQHHGYPTPLLDWTYSPFVAAFFAYRHVEAEPKDSKVRIFCFDLKAWLQKHPSILFVDGPVLHFSVAEFLAIENERMVPQQSVSSVTNVDDMESFIRFRETAEDATYLRAIDLPSRARGQVMRELQTMGITAGSLFPGLDGACEELTERFFPCS
jgi:hypothetical protein